MRTRMSRRSGVSPGTPRGKGSTSSSATAPPPGTPTIPTRTGSFISTRDAMRRSPTDCAGNADAGRPARPCGVQNLHYTYDAAGNITHIQDDAQQTIWFANQQVEPSNDYCYDALYRLIEADGRENAAAVGAPPHPEGNWPTGSIPSPDSTRNYTQRYRYDQVGNVARVRHIAAALPGQPDGSWTRDYAYAFDDPDQPGEQSPLADLAGRQPGPGRHVPSRSARQHAQPGEHLTRPGHALGLARHGARPRSRRRRRRKRLLQLRHRQTAHPQAAQAQRHGNRGPHLPWWIRALPSPRWPRRSGRGNRIPAPVRRGDSGCFSWTTC